MTSIEKRLRRQEKKRLAPAPESKFTQQLLAGLDAGRERARAAYKVRGLPLPTDGEPALPPIAAGTFNGMTVTQIQIYLLHRGRERNHLRCLATKPATNKLAPGKPATSKRATNKRATNKEVKVA